MFYDVYLRIFSKHNFGSIFLATFFESEGSSAGKTRVKTPQKLTFKFYFLKSDNL
jgi:hypothetical protein